jgi:signal transduction histidine kinase
VTSLTNRLDRLPVRWKLTLASTILSAIALVALALAILAAFRSTLLHAVDDDLRERSHVLTALVRRDGPRALLGAPAHDVLRPLGAMAQVVGAGSQVLAAGRDSPHRPMAPSRPAGVRTRALGKAVSRSRVLVVALPHGQTLLLARSLSDQDSADGSLGRAFALTGPIVLALVLVGAYTLSGRALSPVELMQRRAASMSSTSEGGHLPVPAADDEISHLGRTLNALLDRAALAAQHERALIADASHELRTPLARLQTRLDRALSSPQSAEELSAALLATAEEVRGVSSLATDLLTLASLDEAQGQLVIGSLDLLDLVDDVTASHRGALNAVGRAIAVRGEPVVVDGDAAALRQALHNLVVNASVHGEGAVVVTVADAGAEVTISVQDEGSGLDLPLEAAIERFARGPRGRKRQGSGLGLALASAVATAHGGALRAEPGATSIVTLALPRS